MAEGSITSSVAEQLGKSDKKQSGTDSSGKIAQLFTSIQASLNSSLVQSTQAVYAFKVKGTFAYFL